MAPNKLTGTVKKTRQLMFTILHLSYHLVNKGERALPVSSFSNVLPQILPGSEWVRCSWTTSSMQAASRRFETGSALTISTRAVTRGQNMDWIQAVGVHCSSWFLINNNNHITIAREPLIVRTLICEIRQLASIYLFVLCTSKPIICNVPVV